MKVMEALLDPHMSIQETENDDLIRRIAAGDEEALHALYRLYGQRLYACAMRITGDAHLADEAFQETLLAVWRDAGRFRGEGRPIAWLLGIVHHKSLNALRSRPGPPLPESDTGPAEPADPSPSPTDLVDRSERRRSLLSGMEQLSQEHRLVLDLVFYQGLTLAETAEVCGCPIGTVKSRLAYAKDNLRGVLSRAGYPAEGNG